MGAPQTHAEQISNTSDSRRYVELQALDQSAREGFAGLSWRNSDTFPSRVALYKGQVVDKSEMLYSLKHIGKPSH
jgi:hypothetical protein